MATRYWKFQFFQNHINFGLIDEISKQHTWLEANTSLTSIEDDLFILKAVGSENSKGNKMTCYHHDNSGERKEGSNLTIVPFLAACKLNKSLSILPHFKSSKSRLPKKSIGELAGVQVRQRRLLSRYWWVLTWQLLCPPSGTSFLYFGPQPTC